MVLRPFLIVKASKLSNKPTDSNRKIDNYFVEQIFGILVSLFSKKKCFYTWTIKGFKSMLIYIFTYIHMYM